MQVFQRAPKLHTTSFHCDPLSIGSHTNLMHPTIITYGDTHPESAVAAVVIGHNPA